MVCIQGFYICLKRSTPTAAWVPPNFTFIFKLRQLCNLIISTKFETSAGEKKTKLLHCQVDLNWPESTWTTSCRRQRLKAFQGDFWQIDEDELTDRGAQLFLAPCWLFKRIYFRPVLFCHRSRLTMWGLILEMAEMNKSQVTWGGTGCDGVSSIQLLIFVSAPEESRRRWSEGTPGLQVEERMWSLLTDRWMYFSCVADSVVSWEIFESAKEPRCCG